MDTNMPTMKQKNLEGLKMGWMFFWRLLVISFIVPTMDFNVLHGLLSFGAGFFIAHVLKFSITAFPLLSVFTRLSPIYRVGTKIKKDTKSKEEMEEIYASLHRMNEAKRKKNNATPVYAQTSVKTKSGVHTGYEPSALASVALAHTPLMVGVPGHGLDDSTQTATMEAKNVSHGQLGEINLSKALAVTGRNGKLGVTDIKHSLLNSVHTYWSLSMPSEHNPAVADTKYSTDIDCVVVSGRKIVLIDAKLYRGGNVIYKAGDSGELVTVDAETGMVTGKPYRMGRNMSMALDRFKKHYPSMDVSAMVVLVTPESGEAARIDTTWEGGIPLHTTTSAMESIANIASMGGIHSPVAYVDRNLKGLRR